MAARQVREFLIKITKFCNLRCTYCNEYLELHNPARMSLKAIGEIFQKVAKYASVALSEPITFIWHGGEPFAVPLGYYSAIAEIQRDAFGEEFSVVNGIQTNLTILTDCHLEFLASEKFFARLGISFDPYGDQRIDRRGKLRADLVLKHIQTLIDHQIEFGALTVLARNTFPHARRIYEFYDRLGVASKFVPFYLNSFDRQIVDHALTHTELVQAYNSIFDAWLSSPTATTVEPIEEYLGYAIAYLQGRTDLHYDREEDEHSVIVNLDGGVWAPNDTYVSELRYGNLLHETLDEILDSKARKLVIDRARQRQIDYCSSCRYFGACPGIYVADASPQQQDLLAESGCPARAVLDHMVMMLDRMNLRDICELRHEGVHPM